MSGKVVKFNVNEKPLPPVPTYIGRCCREWVLAIAFRGRCGLCGEVPEYVRPDE